MKKSDELRQKIAALTDEAQALHNVAEKENRDLTAEESTKWTAIMASDTGELAKAEAELASAVAHENEVSRLRSLRLNQNQSQNESIPTVANAAVQPIVNLRVGSLKAFKGAEAQKDAYDSGQWLKSLLGYLKGSRDEKAEQHILSKRGWDIRATATEGTPSAGGYLVPAPLSNAIIDVRELAGVSRQLARVVPMTGDTLDIPKKTDGPTVYYPAEAASITASDQTWGAVSLTAKKRAILSYVSQELNDDAIINVMDDLASQMGTEFAVQEDNELINGDGTATYGGETGLLSSIHASALVTGTTTTEDTWAELTVANHANTMGKLNSKWWPYGTAWLCSAQYYYQVMVRLLAAAGGNAVMDLQSGAAGRPMFLGSPVYFSNSMPTSTAVSTTSCLFGAFNQAVIIGDRMGIRVATSDQFAFDTDRLAIRATARYDINVHESAATGPISGLKTGAAA